MRGLLAVAALVIVAAAAANTDPSAPAEPPAAEQPAAPELDEDGLPPRIPYDGELTHTCEGPDLLTVAPDTPAARASAERACLRLHLSTERAPWPDNVHP
jgi:hypothetical protein